MSIYVGDMVYVWFCRLLSFSFRFIDGGSMGFFGDRERIRMDGQTTTVKARHAGREKLFGVKLKNLGQQIGVLLFVHTSFVSLPPRVQI